MKLNIYAVYDAVAQTFTQPMFMHNDNEAKRLFNVWCNNPELPMHAHPADYSLMAVGFYDTDTGIIEPQAPINQIMRGSLDEPPTTNQTNLHAVGEE